MLSAPPHLTLGYPSDIIPAGVQKTLHDSKPDRVRYKGEHDGDLQLSFLERNRGRRRDCDDDNRPLRSELVDKRFQPNGVSFPAEKIDVRVPVAKLAERFEPQMDSCALRKSTVQNTDPRPVLRARRKGPRARRRTAEKPDAIAPLHLSP